MERSASPNSGASIPLLRDEEIEMALHGRLGLTADVKDARNILMITNHRIISSTSVSNQNRLCIILKEKIDGIEVVDIERPREKLLGGVTLLVAGFLIGWAVWIMFGLSLPAIAFGGIPMVISIWVLASYAFPEERSEIIVYSGSLALRHPLQTPEARCDAYKVVQAVSDHRGIGTRAWNWIR